MTSVSAYLTKEQHPLTFKVIQLLHYQIDEDKDEKELITSSITNPSNFEFQQKIIPPETQQELYLGETFSCLIQLHNEGSKLIESFSIRVEVQTTTQRYVLKDTGKQDKAISPDQPVEMTLHYDLKELGLHSLMCSIQYHYRNDTQSDALIQRNLRKYFRFQVLNPLNVKTKIKTFQQSLFIEIRIQNITRLPLSLEKLVLDSADVFDIKELSCCPGEHQLIGPQDVYQYLFQLDLKDPTKYRLDQISHLGRLDISWRNKFGLPGRLQTSQLVRKVTGIELVDFEARVLEDLKLVKEVPFTVVLSLKNASSNPMDLQVMPYSLPTSAVLYIGTSPLSLASLPPSESVSIHLTFLPLESGVIQVGPVKVTDSISHYSRVIDSILDIFVLNSPISD